MMTMLAFILAEVQVESHYIPPTQWWMVGFGAVATCVSMLTLFATRRDLEAANARITSLEDSQKELTHQLQTMEARLSKASEERAVQTHNRINEVLEATSKLGGRLEGLIEQTREISRAQHNTQHGH